jgi:hypothetical protein
VRQKLSQIMSQIKGIDGRDKPGHEPVDGSRPTIIGISPSAGTMAQQAHPYRGVCLLCLAKNQGAASIRANSISRTPRRERRLERVPGRGRGEFQIAHIGAQPQAHPGADRNHHDIIGTSAVMPKPPTK